MRRSEVVYVAIEGSCRVVAVEMEDYWFECCRKRSQMEQVPIVGSL